MIERKRSSETYLRIDLGETIEYASIQKTIHPGYTLTKWTQVSWINFEDSWTSYIDLAKFDHPRVHMEQVACWCRKRMVNGVCASTTECRIRELFEIHILYLQCNPY